MGNAFIDEAQKSPVGMDIKSRETVTRSDNRPLRDVAAGLGSKWRGGIVIYRGNEIRKTAEPFIWAVPSRRLFIGRMQLAIILEARIESGISFPGRSPRTF